VDLIALGAFGVLVIAWIALPLRPPVAEPPVELDKAA
jgi:hypothetical protein